MRLKRRKNRMSTAPAEAHPLMPELQRIRDEVPPERYALASAAAFVELHRKRKPKYALT